MITYSKISQIFFKLNLIFAHFLHLVDLNGGLREPKFKIPAKVSGRLPSGQQDRGGKWARYLHLQER